MKNTQEYTAEQKAHYKFVVSEIKNLLKELAVEQREDKHARKEKARGNQDTYRYDWDIASRKYRITAILNFYLEFQGKAYRHAAGNEEYLNCGIYQAELRDLRNKYEYKEEEEAA